MFFENQNSNIKNFSYSETALVKMRNFLADLMFKKASMVVG